MSAHEARVYGTGLRGHDAGGLDQWQGAALDEERFVPVGPAG